MFSNIFLHCLFNYLGETLDFDSVPPNDFQRELPIIRGQVRGMENYLAVQVSQGIDSAWKNKKTKGQASVIIYRKDNL